jgi:hypothetical protein
MGLLKEPTLWAQVSLGGVSGPRFASMGTGMCQGAADIVWNAIPEGCVESLNIKIDDPNELKRALKRMGPNLKRLRLQGKKVTSAGFELFKCRISMVTPPHPSL